MTQLCRDCVTAASAGIWRVSALTTERTCSSYHLAVQDAFFLIFCELPQHPRLLKDSLGVACYAVAPQWWQEELEAPSAAVFLHVFLPVSWLGSARSRANQRGWWGELTWSSPPLQPADGNRRLLFLPPERLGFHAACLHIPLVRVRESFRPHGEGQLPSGSACLLCLPALPASATGTSDLHPSCLLSSFSSEVSAFYMAL